MKKLYKGISFLLASAALFSLTACRDDKGKGGGGVDRFTGELERNVKIRVQENGVAIEKGFLADVVKAFNAEYAQYGITAVDANMSDSSNLEEDGPYGYGPDVLYGANDVLMPYVKGKHILPLPTERLDCYESIDERAWEAYEAEVEGTEYTFGVPVNIQEPVLFYRRDLIPENWETEWDDDKNGVPDMIENMNAMYAFSLQRKAEGNFGIMFSFFGAYNVVGFLYTYGGYTFGNNNKDVSDIGHGKGDAEKGGNVMRRLASVMDQRCLDDSLMGVTYSNIGDGKFFATVITPDTYSLFIDEMMNAGMTREEAVANLGVADVPMLPKSGDLTEENAEFLPTKMMGGVNAYAISSYTKAPNASLAFINFATQYEIVKKRSELLGIVPARTDIAEDVGGLSKIVNQNLEAGKIVVMPSVREVSQIWTPLTTVFTDIAKDAFRSAAQVKYDTLDKIKAALQTADKQIYDSIFTLQ